MSLPTLWPLLVYTLAVVGLAAGMLGVSYVLGPRPRRGPTAEPYESGIVSTGTARLRLSVKFYLIAMFFVIFDLESVFVYVWAISLREVGWHGYVEMLVFVGVLVAAWAYLWRLGALDWGTRRHKIERN